MSKVLLLAKIANDSTYNLKMTTQFWMPHYMTTYQKCSTHKGLAVSHGLRTGSCCFGYFMLSYAT